MTSMKNIKLPSNKGILWRMAEFRKMHKFVQFVHEENTRTLKRIFTKDIVDTHDEILMLNTKNDLLKNYGVESNIKSYEIYEICQSAIEFGYLEEIGEKTKYLKVTAGKGKNLLYKLFRFKLGVWNETIRHFGILLTLILTVFTSAILGNIHYLFDFIASII